MIKQDGVHVILDDMEVERIRAELHDEALSLFGCSLRGGIFGVCLSEGYPFYFLTKQLLAEYHMSIAEFLNVYPNGLLSTVHEKDQEMYLYELQQSLSQGVLFDRIFRIQHSSHMSYMRDIAKQVTLHDGMQMILVLRCNVSEVFEEQLKLEHEAMVYAQQNKQLEELTVKIPCAVCMLSINDHFNLHFANDEFYHLLKYKEAQLREEKKNFIDALIYEQDMVWLKEKINQSILNKDKEIQLENRIVCRDGSVIWLLVKGYFSYHKSTPEMICSFMDITKRKKTEEDAKISEERFRIALSVTDSTIFEYDVKNRIMIHGDRSAITYGLQHITENVPESLLEMGTVHPDSADDFLNMYHKIQAGSKTASCLVRARMVEDGYVWRKIIMTNIFDEEGNPVQAIGVLEDVDEQVKREERLLYQTERDSLTGLYNRRFMVSNIERELSNKSNPCLRAIMIIDIDDFKTVNDTKGHLFGDFVLTESAKRICRPFLKDVYIGRIGGDEFIAYFQRLDNMAQAKEYATLLVHSFQDIFIDRGNQIQITCSVGYALFPTDGEDFETLYQNADAALYTAKKSGKNMVVGYHDI